MEIVAGISLKNLNPRVWDQKSEYYLPGLKAVMVSYADFHQMPAKRRQAMEQGLRKFLGVPKKVKIYLDNGAFYFITHDGKTPVDQYQKFVENAKPDWCPIPQDFIPTPKMEPDEQEKCFIKTMEMNLDYRADPEQYFPVIHTSSLIEDYVSQIKKYPGLLSKSCIAVGGIVPNLLRAPKAMSHQKILEGLQHARDELRQQNNDLKLHVFGIGGTATIHLAALLGFDSVDSSGWRNRAARGIIQLPGTGERIVAELGCWRGRRLSQEELEKLEQCKCPACQRYGIDGLRKSKTDGKGAGGQGFYNRATHNLWVLLQEAKQVQEKLKKKKYKTWYVDHLDNTIYRPLIDQLVKDLP